MKAARLKGWTDRHISLPRGQVAPIKRLKPKNDPVLNLKCDVRTALSKHPQLMVYRYGPDALPTGAGAACNPGDVACCADAEIGHAAAAPPSKLVNSRRLIASLEAQDRRIIAVQIRVVKGCPMSALGHQRTFAVQKGMSALPPESGH